MTVSSDFKHCEVLKTIPSYLFKRRLLHWKAQAQIPLTIVGI